MKNANRIDCRPLQFKNDKHPKKTNMCGEHCPYWFVCNETSSEPKPRLTKKEYMSMWYKNNREKVNISQRKYRKKIKITKYLLTSNIEMLKCLYMERAYKYRIYPTKTQQILLGKHFGATRWIFNYGLDKKIRTYEKTKKSPSCFDIMKELPKLKKENEWLKEVNAQSLQMSLRQLDNAYTAFFKKKNRFPNFKSRKGKNSFGIPQGNKIDFEKGIASFIKIGKIKIIIDRIFKSGITRATISKNRINQYFVSYITDNKQKLPVLKKVREKTTIGIDMGLKDFIVISDGKKITNPKYMKKSEQRLKILQKRLSRKKKGSQNRKKARFKVSKIHNKITNQRSNFLHNLTYQITHENQVNSIAIENLNINGMMKNHCLAKSISDASWGEFVRQLTYKCKWYGKNLLVIGRFEPSSKMCSKCGWINQGLKLSNRKWICPDCKTLHDRDINAAINIKKFALSPTLSGVEPVEMPHFRGSVKQESELNL